MAARILVIEDDKNSRELVVYLLKVAGYVPIAAPDGGQGIALVRSEHPDLVICDLQMPVLTGYEVLAQVRAHPDIAHTPVIAVTAYSMQGDRETALAAGFNGYFSKPIDPERFLLDIAPFLPPNLRASPSAKPGA